MLHLIITLIVAAAGIALFTFVLLKERKLKATLAAEAKEYHQAVLDWKLRW